MITAGTAAEAFPRAYDMSVLAYGSIAPRSASHVRRVSRSVMDGIEPAPASPVSTIATRTLQRKFASNPRGVYSDADGRVDSIASASLSRSSQIMDLRSV